MYTKDKILERFREIHGNKYDYSKVDFCKTTVKACIICPKHGEFWQEPHTHLKGQGCPKCGSEKRAKAKTSNSNDFIIKSSKVHNNVYDYSKVEYINNKTKVCITCPKHGDFWIQPNAHLQGRGCFRCGNEKKGTHKKLNTESFINKAKMIHGEKYDYSKVEYIDYKHPVILSCPSHGDFFQTPEVHLMGSACPECAKEHRALLNTLTTDEFIKRAQNIHGNYYDYSKVNYVNYKTPIEIICPEHGLFTQKPYIHLSGSGCQKCGALYSHYEFELGDFIADLIGEENIIRNDRDVLNGIEMDIYIPSKKIAFEFDGLYWHSEIKKPNKKYHLRKTELCNENGIHLIHIFEDEWVNKQDVCKSRIKHLLGFSEKIPARKCKVVELDNKSAKIFFEENHIQGSVSPKIVYGLEYNGEIISAMSFGGLRRNLGSKSSKNCYELLRFCNKKDYSITGGASKIFKHFIKKYNPSEVVTYADRRWSKGKLYEELNFSFSHTSEPSYFYVINGERKNRFGFRKDVLISEYGCSPDDTEHNFCFKQGWYRIYDCGTMVYKWKSTQ